jgi:hypothetical protein
VPAGDVEGYHDAVAGRDVLDIGADLLDYAHRLVPDDVSLAHQRRELGVEVQIRAADRGRGDPYYGVG